MNRELIKYLEKLKSCIVTYSNAGGGAGSIVLIDIRDNSGFLYTLWIESTWRIEKGNKIIATSADDIEAVTGLIATSVKMLEGKMIDSTELSPFHDLCIYFTDNLRLKVFNIFSYSDEDSINWRLSIPSENICYVVTNQFEVKKELYDTEQSVLSSS